MDDLISRTAAIDALDKCHCGGRDENGNPWIYKENAVEAIETVEPSPSVEPKRGKWIQISKFPDRVEAYWVTCSACDRRIFGGGKFCPHCGADMRGEQDG